MIYSLQENFGKFACKLIVFLMAPVCNAASIVQDFSDSGVLDLKYYEVLDFEQYESIRNKGLAGKMPGFLPELQVGGIRRIEGN